MKAWMKALIWFGLGGGIGFFAGFQAGNKNRVRSDLMAYDQGETDVTEFEAEAEGAFGTYRGDTSEDLDEDGFPNTSPGEDDEEDDAEMPDPPPPIDDLDGDEIPELHPQDIAPRQIHEEEYYENPKGLYQEHLYFYELDEVLYNPETKEAIANKNKMDQLIGIGMTFCFYKSDGEALDAIFVENDTLGVMFRIDRIDAAYTDEIAGKDAPEYQEDEDAE